MSLSLQLPSHADQPAFWVLGTDTEVGKTAVSIGLLAALERIRHAAGADAEPFVYVKPVQTGTSTASENGPEEAPAGDARSARERGFPSVTLFSFAAPASPALAARLEGRHLTAREILERLTDLTHAPEGALCRAPLLLEGAGGLLVPINERETMLDAVRESGFPAVLVVGNKLGAVNHARLSIDRLLSEGIPLLGIILNRTSAPDALDPGTLGSGLSAEGEDSVGKPALAAQRTFLHDNAETLAATYAPEGVALLADLEFGEIDLESGREKLDRAAEHICSRLSERTSEKACRPAGADHAQSGLAYDREHIWHPYANPIKPPRIDWVEGARGTTLTLADPAGGRPIRVIDATSAWWCAPFGASHPRLVARLKRQASAFPHVMFGGLTHSPAVELTERLMAMLPAAFSEGGRVFYSDSGSVAVEVARKMALQYAQAAGTPEKQRFLVPLGGYHGDTAGAMSFCDPIDGMHGRFRTSLRSEIFIEPPASRFDAPFDPASLGQARQAFEAHGSEIAGVILEPIAQCAGGMRFYHPLYLKGLKELCARYGALLIFDEIATGFGRTGRHFAFEHAGVVPDILCIGKALTGGVLGMAATLAARGVVETVGREADASGGGIFPHGPTYMANPLASAVAAESLALYASHDWLAEVGRLEAALRSGLAPLAKHPKVADVRVLGAIGVVELKAEPAGEAAARMKAAVLDEGVWLRPFGRLVYAMPAFITTNEEVERIVRAMARAVELAQPFTETLHA